MMNLSKRMLTKEEEDAAGDEIEVRREDQDKINKFSRLHSHELILEEELKVKNVRLSLCPNCPEYAVLNPKQKEKEELDDISTELELADEDEKVPYKIGDSFFHLPLEQAQELLGLSMAKIEEEIGELEDKMSAIREEMTQLKVELYARFGKTINLET
ncbi:Prefoldin subunit-domain-containing protein [Podospora fimiseda]|uniref:Prefoldin subunit 4 n=1 Tax=Podospora fimiseda TaxID=252190 RepID=A0AAN7GU69_9PEZI|nr:Prefoldin subunit-domain-containing protein [Podospora fimiseda]